jgi:hypothetical protein
MLACALVASCASSDPVQQGSAGASAGGTVGAAAGGVAGVQAGSAGSSMVIAGTNSGGQGGANDAVGGSNSGGKSSGGASGSFAGGGTSGNTSAGANGAGDSAGGASGRAGASGSSGTAGSGGAPAKYCDSHPLAPAPFTMTEHFDDAYVSGASQMTEHALPSVCPSKTGAVGTCAEWTYKPDVSNPIAVKLQWLSDPAGVKYAPTCLVAGMTRVTFAAKGNAGGEKLTFGASQATPIVVTLTNAWAEYSISLTGVNYNSDAVGVQPGFFWQTDPANGTIRFAVDDIKYVNN